MLLVDLNCDMGELQSLYDDGTQAALMESVTSVNISCGAHAGDETLIEKTIRAAVDQGVRIGAHPGYPDRANFGRVEMAMDRDSLAREITRQLSWFAGIAERCGAEVVHVKPHGALYNVAVQSRDVADAIARGVGRWRSEGIVVMGLAGSSMLDVFREHGLTVWGEAFADRSYEADGTLRRRSLPGALIEDPASAAAQARALAERPDVDTICIHSDTPGSAAIAQAVRAALLH